MGLSVGGPRVAVMEGKATQALADRREGVAAACTALKDLSAVLWQCQNAELGPLLRQIDALARAAEAGRVAVVQEALQRGEADTSAAGPPRAWVEHWAPSFHAGGAGRLVDVARELLKNVHTRCVPRSWAVCARPPRQQW